MPTRVNICTKLRPVSADTRRKPLICIGFSDNASWGSVGHCPQSPFFPLGNEASALV